ncbi:MAG: DUF4056 domain-containing protein [Myxococcota bacterium]
MTRQPDVLDAAEILGASQLGLVRDERAEEVPRVPVRTKLRPCCAFGSGLGVRVGSVALPGVSIGNIRSPEELGRHRYDAGRFGQNFSAGTERNGLIYTCRGGFIDTAHVRDYADWTLYLATEIGRHLETGGLIEIPGAEAGMRRIRIEPVDPALIQALGRRQVTASLAVWMGFQLSIWHEIATWYGWSSFEVFSERASAFSPEDLYSNLLGAKLAGPIITAGNDLSEDVFNAAVDAWFARSLEFLGGLPADLGEAAMSAVDQVWWDSEARLPDPQLVLRRNIQNGLKIQPWLVPVERISSKASARVREACGESAEPHTLRQPTRVPGLDYAKVLALEIEISPDFKAVPVFDALGGQVSNSDFPLILDQIREEVRVELGALGDQPLFPAE